jgi:hypothetical protein
MFGIVVGYGRSIYEALLRIDEGFLHFWSLPPVSLVSYRRFKLVESVVAVEGNFLIVTFLATNEVIAVFRSIFVTSLLPQT